MKVLPCIQVGGTLWKNNYYMYIRYWFAYEIGITHIVSLLFSTGIEITSYIFTWYIQDGNSFPLIHTTNNAFV